MRRTAIIVLASCAFAGCNCSGERPAAPAVQTTSGEGAKGAPGAQAPSGPALAATPIYRLDAATPVSCKVHEVCTAKVVLTALSGHKVNHEYPTKFVAAGTGDVSVRGTGTFAVEAKERGVLTVEVEATRPGDHVLEGTFKLSVCTEERCEIESAKIGLAITAT